MNFKQLIDLIRSDISRRLLLEGKPINGCRILQAVFHRGVFSVLLYRLRRYLFLKNNRLLNLLVWFIRFPEYFICHNEIDPRAQIGEGFVISNYGGIGISHAVIIGNHCTIMGRATPTLGAMEHISEQDRITIGNHCVIGHNVRIINPINIADGVHIKANSVVITSIKTIGAVVSGFPARTIHIYKDKEMQNWNPLTAKPL